ncbi:MAG: hypothetical protein KGL54_08165 [Sphingomonadales bacterium]|nr:hypothetical protein [Sphingomonadales bacterium]
MITRTAKARHEGFDKGGQGFRITRSDLTLTSRVPGISDDEFRSFAPEAKANCPASRLLHAEAGLEICSGD